MEKTRLNKFLSWAGASSRRNADKLIEQGRIIVNGKVVRDFGYKIDPEKDVVMLDGERVKPKSHVYYLFHKPAGYITSLKDERGRKTIFEIFRVPQRVFPVGRLDRDTTGVLLLTNDGDFANFMMHPKNKIPREYLVKLDKPLTENIIRQLKKVHLSDGVVEVEELTILDQNKQKVKILLREGRNRVVKRIFAKFNYKVIALHRISYASFTVAHIPVGKWVKIPVSEIKNAIKRYENK